MLETDEGLCTDPEKVRATSKMPPPNTVAGVQALLAPSVFEQVSPSLSDTTNPLKELTQMETEWAWDHPQQEVLEILK